MLDNRYDPAVAVRNAEEFVTQRVDLVLEFQVEEAAAPRVAHIFKKADIPLVAIDVPHPNATYFGVDNFEVGYEAAAILAQYAQRRWKGRVDRVVGVGFSEAGTFVQNRISGAFDGIRERFNRAQIRCHPRLRWMPSQIFPFLAYSVLPSHCRNPLPNSAEFFSFHSLLR